MIILHAAFLADHLCLWGEQPVPTDLPIAPKSTRKTKGPETPPPLLFDPGPFGLMSELALAGLRPASPKGKTESKIIWQPTLDGKPIASSSLIAELPDQEEQVKKSVIQSWTITVLPLPMERSVEFLGLCVDKPTLGPGLIIGKDLAFWSRALRFAGALVTRQQFLPALAEKVDFKNIRYQALWKPILSGPDQDRLNKLAKAMPQIGRALTEKALAPPGMASLIVLSRFIHKTVDYLVRSAAGDKTERPRPSLKPKDNGDSLHDQWIRALQDSDGKMEGTPADFQELAQQIQDWQYPVSLFTNTPYRLSFRLEEPEEGFEKTTAKKPKPQSKTDDWYLRYLLQGVEDPSLFFPVQDIWGKGTSRIPILKRSGFNPQEYLLGSLGQASKVFPAIEAGLKTQSPGGVQLNAHEAYAFLHDRAWVLEQAGFGIIVPAWWTGQGTKRQISIRAKVKAPKMKGRSGFFLDQILEFNWELALGGEKLFFEELQTLARLKAPLVKYRGQWVQMGPEEIQAALEFWRKKETGQTTAREIIQLALGARKAFGDLPFEGIQAQGWVAELIKQLEGHIPFVELSPSRRFQGRLRPYQTKGFSWLAFLGQWGLGACLADDMGLGKTIQALALIQQNWQQGGKKPVLLICPMSVVNNWEKEAARFTPELPVLIHHGITRTKGEAFKKSVQKQALVISSYALLHRDFEIFKKVSWAGVILDEAQNIKNPETKQAKAARAISADYRIALTGTPVENHVGDLWSIMEFLNPGFLGSPTEFRRNFFIPIQAEQNQEAMERLKRLTSPFILRRLKTDKAIIRDLPKKMEMKVFCPLTKEQAGLYSAVVKDSLEAIEASEGIGRKGAVLATLIKLKQVCNHPAQFLKDHSPIPGRSGKLARLTEMIEEIMAIQESALVFTQFTEMGAILKKHLEEIFGQEVLFLHGAVPKKQRDRMVERFQGNGNGPRLFILSLKAGGTGLNLIRANHVFHFDRWWNPAVENQATDRVFRIGQTKNVQVHKFLCAGTLEEKIDHMIDAKQEMAGRVIGSGEAWLTELSTKDLRELFALRKEAIGE
ncbi:MAG: DEAD/DEAH box helicase [Thermodesulfobacteriota bacterium]